MISLIKMKFKISDDQMNIAKYRQENEFSVERIKIY